MIGEGSSGLPFDDGALVAGLSSAPSSASPTEADAYFKGGHGLPKIIGKALLRKSFKDYNRPTPSLCCGNTGNGGDNAVFSERNPFPYAQASAGSSGNKAGKGIRSWPGCSDQSPAQVMNKIRRHFAANQA
jgi:hypothetical protein